MQNCWIIGVCAPAAYLLGAVPFGLLLARLKGVDLRTVGSGNIGATNVFRSVSKPLGIITFALDALKGFLPAWAGRWLPLGLPDPSLAGLLLGICAIAGHNWPIYLRFKGGKGVATSAGMLLGVAPAGMGVGLAVWIVLIAVTRYVSVASMGAAMAVMTAGWFLYRDHGWTLPVALTLLGAVVIWRHRGNIQRLMNGTEHKFGRKKASR